MLTHVWVLEEFLRSDDSFTNSWTLEGFSDSDMASILEVDILPPADLMDISDGKVGLLAVRYDFSIDTQRCYYLVGRSQPPASTSSVVG